MVVFITKPPYLHVQHSLGFTEPPPSSLPLFSGRPPVSETLDGSGSTFSTKFRKPLATSNHYWGKKGEIERERD